MIVTVFGIKMLFKLKQRWNAPKQILVTDLGISISVMPVLLNTF